MPCPYRAAFNEGGKPCSHPAVLSEGHGMPCPYPRKRYPRYRALPSIIPIFELVQKLLDSPSLRAYCVFEHVQFRALFKKGGGYVG